jgi:SPP1 gp7 family putative phage head morphogenesis protein
MSRRHSKRIENQYAYTLNRLFKTMHKFVGANVQDPQDIIRRLQLYASSSAYKQWCDEIALNVTTQVNKGVSATWRQASQKAGRGSELYSAILEELTKPNGGVFSDIVRGNAEILKTFPLNISEDLTEYIAKEAMQGRRGTDIMQDLLQRFPDTAKSRLQLIARTEVSKTQSALTQSRAQALGLNWYIWRTSEDSRVRSAHRHMEGVLVNWNNPPSPEMFSPNGEQAHYGYYHAGDTFNCRCYAEAVVNFDYVDFPIKVYRDNYTAKMTRAAFEKIA